MSHSAVPFTVEGKVTMPCPLIITAEESGEAKRNIQCQSPTLSRKQLIAERFVLFPECVSSQRGYGVVVVVVVAGRFYIALFSVL